MGRIRARIAMSPSDVAAGREASLLTMQDEVEVLKKEVIRDAAGSIRTVYRPIAIVPALVRTRQLPFQDAAGSRIVMKTVWEVTVPYDTEIRQDDRLRYQDSTLEITGVDSRGTNQFTIGLGCVEVK